VFLAIYEYFYVIFLDFDNSSILFKLYKIYCLILRNLIVSREICEKALFRMLDSTFLFLLLFFILFLNTRLNSFKIENVIVP